MGAQNRWRNCRSGCALLLDHRVGAELLQPRLGFGGGQAAMVGVAGGGGRSQGLLGHRERIAGFRSFVAYRRPRPAGAQTR